MLNPPIKLLNSGADNEEKPSNDGLMSRFEGSTGNKGGQHLWIGAVSKDWNLPHHNSFQLTAIPQSER